MNSVGMVQMLKSVCLKWLWIAAFVLGSVLMATPLVQADEIDPYVLRYLKANASLARTAKAAM